MRLTALRRSLAGTLGVLLALLSLRTLQLLLADRVDSEGGTYAAWVTTLPSSVIRTFPILGRTGTVAYFTCSQDGTRPETYRVTYVSQLARRDLETILAAFLRRAGYEASLRPPDGGPGLTFEGHGRRLELMLRDDAARGVVTVTASEFVASWL